MKKKFDKYWGECNLLMSIAAILDPRCKMRVIEFSFPKIYDKDEARDNIQKVKEALYELYNEYVAEMYSDGSTQSDEAVGSALNCTNSQESVSVSGWSEFTQFVKVRKSLKRLCFPFLDDGRFAAICMLELDERMLMGIYYFLLCFIPKL
ncbi:hypothetical protein C2S53_002449 [Perilla frutescens var. hirtella]|uniref:hAT-like transposase RNase-H fold domain-containing protein n=1 Tax=Perilla frutescens var. hirtella TaxID=608512 RepID=A0AAD4IPP0_PERFH|nr:hypothetical protein C2S53_002449 [Perilla frutescens var. hirtella]